MKDFDNFLQETDEFIESNLNERVDVGMMKSKMAGIASKIKQLKASGEMNRAHALQQKYNQVKTKAQSMIQ